MITSTSYEEMTIGDLLKQIEDRRVALPRYQRDVVWPPDKKRKLIDSVLNGFPVGSLLLAEIDQIIDGVVHKAWRIIDGLQRTSTFQAYVSDPADFIERTWVKQEWVDLATSIVHDATQLELEIDAIKQAILEFMLQPKSSRDRLSLFVKLAEVSKSDVEKFTSIVDQLNESANTLISQITDSLDITNRRIPVIKFVGSQEDQATAFAGLNTGSVQLNKYEIAASIWRKPCKVTNQEVRDEIKSYWRDRLDNLQLEIDGIAEDGTPDSYMLFDVLVGLGRLLGKKYPLIVKAEWGDTFGFQIAGVVHKLRSNSVSSIEDQFKLADDGLQIEVDDFVTSALDATKRVEVALQPVLGLKLTARTVRSQFQDHTVLQACSFIASVMIESADESGGWSKPIPGRSAAQNKSMANWYLIDRLRGEWGNAGDTLLFNRVWKDSVGSSGGATLEPNPIYMSSPDTRLAEVALDNWFEEEISRNHRERELISAETKLVLRFFYSTRVSFAENHAATFHIDHLIPIDFWKTFFEAVGGDGLAINGIGNLCLMNTDDHSTKGVKLPVQWYNNDVIGFPAQRVARCKSEYFLVDLTDFDFASSVESLLSTGGLNEKQAQVARADFEQLSRNRWKIIRDEILKNYFS